MNYMGNNFGHKPEVSTMKIVIIKNNVQGWSEIPLSDDKGNGGKHE